ncbi:MAG: MerR family transcriptional regulator [Acidimicrobiales bacterium]
MVHEDLLGIGRMARQSGLTVKALRYYDRVGLIRPSVVDEVTGFRYYAPEQVPPARLVGRLRSVDVPIDEIRSCLESQCVPAAMERVLLAHRKRLESRATRIAGNLHELAHLLDEGMERIMTNEQPAVELLLEENERKLAARCFNSVWDLMEKEDRTADDDDLMVHMAHASRYHWGQVGKPENVARGEWQVSRVYAVLRRPEPCLYHAQRVLDVCLANEIADWDIAFAYEALARAHAISGDPETARAMTERALDAAEDIKEDEDRKIVLADLETIPDQKRFW